MPWRFLVIGLALAGSPGCALLGSVPLLGNRLQDTVEDHAEHARNRRWAERAYREAEAQAGHPIVADYKDGFVEGFAAFLFRGGSGDPPPLPPARYRALSYQTVEGYRAIEQWFSGYRHGAASARAGGYRELITGPSSLRPAVPPAAAPAEPSYWPKVIVRIDPYWWRAWPCDSQP